SYTVLPSPRVAEDPLKFRDQKPYPARLKAARTSTGEQDAFLNASGTILGRKAVIGVQDFAFMGGSMGQAVGEAFIQGVEAAIAARAPY
ncbi:carboxyl transferase domain-containing protein, partial [Enterobacter hormaechei]